MENHSSAGGKSCFFHINPSNFSSCCNRYFGDIRLKFTSYLFLIRGGGVLPYITYMGMCRPTGSWFWSSWFRTGYPFHRRFLEQGIIFRTHESTSFVSSHLKLFKDRLLLKIRFNALTSKLLYSCCTLERSIKIGPFLERGISFRVNSRMGYKKLAHF